MITETIASFLRVMLPAKPNSAFAHGLLARMLDALDRDMLEAEDHFRRAVELKPHSLRLRLELIEALLRRGKCNAAFQAWTATAKYLEEIPSKWVQRRLHERVCHGFLDRSQYELAESIVTSIPREHRSKGLHRLWNSIRHQRDAEDHEACVFPDYVDFETRWERPRLGTGNPQHWFPGRIVSVNDQEIEIEYGRNSPEISFFGCTMPREAFFDFAQISPRRIKTSTFVELHLNRDGSCRIFIDPRSS